MALRDPDAAIVAVFKNIALPNPNKTSEAGRLVCDDMEVVELRYPGSKNVGVYPATEFSHWAIDQLTGEQVKVTYAERFAHQYRQFKLQNIQTKSGTPLTEVSFLTEARRAELRAFNIYTVEALAEIDGLELKNLGPHGREFKNRAIEFISESRQHAGASQLQAELDALRARNMMLEEDNKRIKNRLGIDEPERGTDENFEGMSLDQLRRYLEVQTGHPPIGAVNRKQLIKMCRDARPAKAA